MIVLKPGDNYTFFTLNEKFDFYTPSVSTYPNLYYVFKITNELSGSELVFACQTDMSSYQIRSNEFHIKVVTSPTASVDISNGEVRLSGSNEDYLSQWQYEVWGKWGPLVGTPSITGGTASLLETGKMLFKN